MRRSSNKMIFGIIGLLVSVVAIGFVYAGFTGTLNISGNGTVSASSWNIHFANLSNATLTGTANVIEAASIKTSTSIGDYLVELIDPGDSITYTFDVVNDGSFDATLTSLTKTAPTCTGLNVSEANTICNYLKYTLRYTSSNRDVAEEDSLLKGETKNMTLKLVLDPNTPANALSTSDITIGGLGITLIYSQGSGYNGSGSTVFHEPSEHYDITYTNITGDYPTIMYPEETLEIDFSGTRYNLIEVYQGNTKLSPVLNYSFENQLLRIFNVSDDIEVRYTGNFCTENNLTKLNDCIIARDVNEPNVNTAKTLIQAKASPDFTKIEPSISYVQKIETGLTGTNITRTTLEQIYFGTGTPTFDSNSGNWSFTRTNIGSIPDYLSDNNTKYYTCLSTTTSCGTLYVIFNYRTETDNNTGKKTYYVTEADRYTYQIDSNSVANNGLYKLEDDYGDTYYYRGIVSDNFVKFGKNSSNQDLYWRIVRVNGDNSIRLIYNGTSTNQTGASTAIGSSKFNNFPYDPAMIGYTYNLNQVYKETTNTLTYADIDTNTNYVFGTSLDCTDNVNKLCTVGGTTVTSSWYNFITSWDEVTPYYTCFGIGTKEGHNATTCSIAMEIKGKVMLSGEIYKTRAYVKYKGYISDSYNTITNPIGSNTKDTDSTIKTYIDTWYENNIKNTTYESYLVDNIFCNDRSLYSGTGDNLEATTYYSPYRRATAFQTPSLSCSRQIDEYTVNIDSTNNRGNGKLDYPIGLITIDEMRAAGGGYNLKNSYYYLYTGQYYWPASPSNFHSNYALASVWYARSAGDLSSHWTTSSLGARPVINLNKNVTITAGNGSASEPFTLSMN